MEATEPKTEDQLVDMLVAPEKEPETDDQDTDAPDIEEDQTEDIEDVSDEDEEDPEGELEPEGETEEDDNSEQPQTFKVKVDGEEVEVTLDELQRSYSGQQYIQKRMHETANARKQAEQQMQALQQQSQQIEQLVQFANAGGFVEPTPPDISMLQSDPIGYMEAKAEYDVQAAQYNQAVQMYQANMQALQQQQQEAFQAHLAEQQKALHEAIPDLADPEKGVAIKSKIRAVAVENYGFTEDELRGIADSRQARVLYDAMRYHELMKNTAKAAAKAEKARPVAKAGTKPKTDPRKAQERKIRERLKRTGSDEDALALLFTG